MRCDHRLSPKMRMESIFVRMAEEAEKKRKQAEKPKRTKRPPCNAWGKRH